MVIGCTNSFYFWSHHSTPRSSCTLCVARNHPATFEGTFKRLLPNTGGALPRSRGSSTLKYPVNLPLNLGCRHPETISGRPSQLKCVFHGIQKLGFFALVKVHNQRTHADRLETSMEFLAVSEPYGRYRLRKRRNAGVMWEPKKKPQSPIRCLNSF